MFFILVFRFEILRVLEVLLDGKDEVVGWELSRSDWDKWRALT